MAHRTWNALLLVLPLAFASGCLRGFDPLALPEDMAVIEDLAMPPPPPPDLTHEQVTTGGGPFDFALPSDDGGPVAIDARTFFETLVLPLLQSCNACHAGSDPNRAFLPKVGTYDAIRAYPGIITRDPFHSLLVTRGMQLVGGKHNGADWLSPGAQKVVDDWLAMEAATLPPAVSGAVFTPPQYMVEGLNTVYLNIFGPHFVGSRLTFTATSFLGGVKITNLTALAGGLDDNGVGVGMQIEHPLFLGIQGNGMVVPDPVDSFDGYEVRVPYAQQAQIGKGLVILTNVTALKQLDGGINPGQPQFAIALAAIKDYRGANIGAGCKDAASFTTFAQPMFLTAGKNGCVSCHDGTGVNAPSPQLAATAKNAFDMSRMADPALAAQAAACAQVLNEVDLKNLDSSAIFTNVEPNTMSNHAMRFSYAGDVAGFNKFKTQIMMWLSKE